MFFDDSSPARRKRAQKEGGAERLRQLASSPVPPAKSYTLFGFDELLHGDKQLIFDTESYKNYWLCAFKCIATGKIVYFEDTPAGYTINGVIVDFATWSNYLTFALHRYLLVGFNSQSYDIPVILVACQGARAYTLKQISDEIIQGEMRAYQIERKYNIKSNNINHIDLIEVAPIQASLKIYAGRLHCERMQDLPFEIDAELTQKQAAIVRDYCINDLDNTHLLYNHLLPHIKLREEIGKKYKQDLRSKSDAQIAETVIALELEALGVKGSKPSYPDDWKFRYQVPDWLIFGSPQLIELAVLIGSLDFEIGGGGKPKFPDSIADYKSKTGLIRVVKKEKDGKRSYAIEVNLHGVVYTMAMGGLHSIEESVCAKSDSRNFIIDRDVASFYPYIILNNRLFPSHLGEAFLEVYRTLVERRLEAKAKAKEAKKRGDKEGEAFWLTEADGLKISINGIFGKLGNYYSKVYAPDLLSQVTITGQLALLMFIDMVGYRRIPVYSANTDGVVMLCPKAKYEQLEDIVTMWEARTNFVTEETRYSAIYSRDVNNYIAIKELERGQNKPEVKTKGTYSEKGSAQNSVLSKNPESLICSQAVQEFLANGVPIEETIEQCRDLRKFVNVKTVKGGAEKDGVYLGKAVRWYYAKGETGEINYAVSGNKVAKSVGAKPLMIMPNELPADLDFDYYINDAIETLYDLGFYKRPEKIRFF